MKSLIITDRDLNFLRTLSSYGILSTGQAHKLCFSSLPKNLMHRRLRKLRRKKIIKALREVTSEVESKFSSPKGKKSKRFTLTKVARLTRKQSGWLR